MTEEEKKDDESKLSFKSADELSNFLMDLQGQIGNIQQTVDKLSPVETEGNNEENNEGEETKEELSDEEVSEIDRLLQTE